MKRASLAAVAVALFSSAVAMAATPKSGTWKAPKGKVQLGYDLKFKVSKGKIKKIVAHVLEQCDGNSTSTVTTFAPDSAWKIKNGKFKGRHKESSSGVTIYYTFKGRFTSSKKAKGILRSESIVAGSTCDTRSLKWSAKAG